MPDRNAAAQRVLSIAKALRLAGYQIKFYGVTQNDDFKGNIDGFEYEACAYPKSTRDWIRYAIGTNIKQYLKQENPSWVFTYNYPAIAQNKIISYCHKKGIRVVGDITEWYRSQTFPKRIDTYLRMHYSNKHLDGLVTISSYLSNYYSRQKYIQIPPLVDKREEKWNEPINFKDSSKIRLIYIGTGSKKDRLDKIIRGISDCKNNCFSLTIIGINENQFYEIYGKDIEINQESITFLGRQPHKEALRLLRNVDFQIFFRDNIRVNNAGFPTKLVESMSAGIPVITNKISNIGDYIINGKNSFMIDEPNKEQITNILHQVSLLSHDDIEKMKESIDKDRFDYHKYSESLSDFMNSLY